MHILVENKIIENLKTNIKDHVITQRARFCDYNPFCFINKIKKKNFN